MLPFVTAFSQEPSKEQMEFEKKMRETIDKAVETYESDFDLEPWQAFYVDSILTHNMGAMSAEMMELGKSRVENQDIYQAVTDKWNERTYEAMRAVLNDQQWAKYLKGGAAKDKKYRDKREAKRQVGK